MVQEFNSSRPIYLQLADRIIQRIIRGELQPGDKLPSVRETAVDSGVNPNTVQRTYSELERMDVSVTKRGQGTFVTENSEVLKEIRNKLKSEHIEAFIDDMEAIGFTEKEIIDGLSEEFSKRKGEES
ncbi:GntR family transcriptional regulator [Bacillus marinisedimentorum]|uniref:GntR family transcriptional regulator n=1 Tax=Bacillus marinisedimentorum TaxID=1821260 RepID=UPI0007DFD5FF|nr:GntR family transcriptional regulator [Bacillus marinisedimentorum]